MLPLGIVNPDGGLLATMVMAYVARLERLGGTDSREAVRSIELVTVPELTTLIAEGRITDGYTLAAYALALSKGMLP
jgi:ADP-ribose pyrophosphatase